MGIDSVGIRYVNNDFDYRTSIHYVDLYVTALAHRKALTLTRKTDLISLIFITLQ